MRSAHCGSHLFFCSFSLRLACCCCSCSVPRSTGWTIKQSHVIEERYLPDNVSGLIGELVKLFSPTLCAHSNGKHVQLDEVSNWRIFELAHTYVAFVNCPPDSSQRNRNGSNSSNIRKYIKAMRQCILVKLPLPFECSLLLIQKWMSLKYWKRSADLSIFDRRRWETPQICGSHAKRS